MLLHLNDIFRMSSGDIMGLFEWPPPSRPLFCFFNFASAPSSVSGRVSRSADCRHVLIRPCVDSWWFDPSRSSPPLIKFYCDVTKAGGTKDCCSSRAHSPSRSRCSNNLCGARFLSQFPLAFFLFRFSFFLSLTDRARLSVRFRVCVVCSMRANEIYSQRRAS